MIEHIQCKISLRTPGASSDCLVGFGILEEGGRREVQSGEIWKSRILKIPDLDLEAQLWL